MNRLLIILSALVLSTALFIACENTDSPLAVVGDDEYTISVSGLETTIEASEDETVAQAFEILVSGEDGNPAGDVPVSINVANGIGSVALVDPVTSTQGIINALYYVIMPYGEHEALLRVIAGKDSVFATVSLAGNPSPAQISFAQERWQLSTHLNQSAELELAVQVANRQGVECPNEPVVFTISSGEGRISNSTITDESGMATATFTADGIYFGETEVTASVVQYAQPTPEISSNLIYNGIPVNLSSFLHFNEREPLTATTVVEITSITEATLAFLTPDQKARKYFQPGDQTISAQLVEKSGEPMAGEWIYFDVPEALGSAPDSAITNEAGIAEIFLSIESYTTDYTIHAEYPTLELTAEMNFIYSSDEDYVAVMELNDAGGIVWNNTQYIVQAAVRYQDDDAPVVGAPLQLYSSLGNESEASGVTDSEGRVAFTCAPSVSGEEELLLKLDDNVISGSYLPVRIFGMPMRFEGEFVMGDGVNLYDCAICNFQLLDVNDLPVPGESVTFEPSFSVMENSEIITDADGRGLAIVRRYDSVEWEGSILVSWRGGMVTLPLRVEPSHVWIDFVRIDSSETLTVPGVGLSSTQIHVDFSTAQRFIGNSFPLNVTYELLGEPNAPAGATFDNGEAIDSVVVPAFTGFFTFTVNAGERIGAKLIRISTWADVNQTKKIEYIISTISVVAGPPRYMDIDIHEFYPEMIDDFTAQLPVTIRLWDRYRNPATMRDQILFNFVTSRGETNTEIFWGESVCEWLLPYAIENAYQPATLRTTVYNGDGGDLIDTRPVSLPWPEAILELNADPHNYMFEDVNDTMIVKLWVDLQSEQGLTINNAPITFRTNQGRLHWLDEATGDFVPYGVNPAIKYTGWQDEHNAEEPGRATVYLIATYEELFDWFMPNFEVTIQINAEIEGFDLVADPSWIFATRRE